MREIFLVAANTFRETIRNKVLYNILIFAAIVIVLSISFGEWSVFARVQVMQDFGLAAMSISGLLLAVFVGVGMLGAEVSSRTIYQMAVKPISRASIIVGKFLGLSLTLMLNFLLTALFFTVSLLVIGGSVNAGLCAAVLLIWVQMLVIVAAALFFSTITNTTVAAMLTIGFYLIGMFNDLLDLDKAQQLGPLFAGLIKAVSMILPNLACFDIRSQVVYEIAIQNGFIAYSILYGIFYAAMLVCASAIIFSRKDL